MVDSEDYLNGNTKSKIPQLLGPDAMKQHMNNGTYELVENNFDLPAIVYKTPCGKMAKIADVFDIGTNDERVQFSPDFPNGSIPRNTIIRVAEILKSRGK